jgi:hypothetical protein
VRLEIETPPASVTDCTCSICRRRGVLWAYYDPDEVEVICAPGATVVYQWNDRCIEFHHCRVCGCTTHYDGVGGEPLRAVNARLLDPDALEGIPVRLFDGAKL